MINPEATVAEVRRHLSATPERVFSAFAHADMVARWLTPSPEIKLTVLAFDFRAGGAYRFAYHVPGGQVMVVNGIYRSIEPPSRIAFSWNIEPPDEHAGLQSEVIVAITPQGDGCELHIRHAQLAQAGAAERHGSGWRGALDQLAASLRSPDATFVQTSPPEAAGRQSVQERKTDMTRFTVGVLAYLMPTFALGFVWHLILFKNYYEALAIYRSDIIIPFGLLAILIQGVIFAWIYVKAIAPRHGSFRSRALAYGALGAALSWTFTTLAVAAKNVMASVPDYLLIETAFTIVQWIMVAPLTVLALPQPSDEDGRVRLAG